MLKIAKTDKRYTGSEHFAYVVDVKTQYVPMIGGNLTTRMNTKASLRYLEFQTVRDWCIQTWGMSCERTIYLDILGAEGRQVNTHWSWHTEFGETKIYLASDKEANWFKLKWI